MAKSDFVKTNDDQFATQLQTFRTGLPAYAALFGITPAQIASHGADTDYFVYVIACLNLMKGSAQQWTAWKNLLRVGGAPPPGGAPVAPVLPAVVLAVMLGIEARFRALVKQIKAMTTTTPPSARPSASKARTRPRRT